jgi:hypothetical protein
VRHDCIHPSDGASMAIARLYFDAKIPPLSESSQIDPAL